MPSAEGAISTDISDLNINRCIRPYSEFVIWQLDSNPFHFIKADLFLASVVKLRRPRRLVVGDLLGRLQLSAVLHVGGDAGRPEGVIADLGFDPCCLRPALDHPVSVLLPHRSFGEIAASATRDRPKQRTLRLAADLGGGDVFIKELLQTVMAGDGVLFARPSHGAAPSPGALVFDLHFKGGVHVGEGADHEADQCAVAQANDRAGVDGVEQGSGLVGVEHRRLALLHDILEAAYRVGRVRLEDMAGDKPVEEHPQGCEVLFHGRGGEVAL